MVCNDGFEGHVPNLQNVRCWGFAVRVFASFAGFDRSSTTPFTPSAILTRVHVLSALIGIGDAWHRGNDDSIGQPLGRYSVWRDAVCSDRALAVTPGSYAGTEGFRSASPDMSLRYVSGTDMAPSSVIMAVTTMYHGKNWA